MDLKWIDKLVLTPFYNVLLKRNEALQGEEIDKTTKMMNPPNRTPRLLRRVRIFTFYYFCFPMLLSEMLRVSSAISVMRTT